MDIAEVYTYEGEVADCAAFQTSNGHLVCISTENGEMWCSCPGFFYRGSCRHVEAVADYICPVSTLVEGAGIQMKRKGRGR